MLQRNSKNSKEPWIIWLRKDMILNMKISNQKEEYIYPSKSFHTLNPKMIKLEKEDLLQIKILIYLNLWVDLVYR